MSAPSIRFHERSTVVLVVATNVSKPGLVGSMPVVATT